MPTTYTNLRENSLTRTINNRVKNELDNIVEDPYALGWDAGHDLDDPLPCPFKDGLAAKLWRQGYNARIDAYIAKNKSTGGLSASLLG